eukprot:4620452-Pyramimonas_sp.AAC.1
MCVFIRTRCSYEPSVKNHCVCLDRDAAICVRGATDFQTSEDVPSETARHIANGTFNSSPSSSTPSERSF